MEGSTVAMPKRPEIARPIPYFVEKFDVSASTIRRMIARGELRAYRIGERGIRIDPADFERALVPVNPAEFAYINGGEAA